MEKNLISVATAIVILFSSHSFAESKSGNRDTASLEPPVKLQLNELIQEALGKNAGLSATKQGVIAKDTQIGPKGSYEDPLLAVEAMNFPVNSLRRDQFGMTGIQVSLTQKIPFPGKLSLLSRAASYQKDVEVAVTDRKRLELIRDVKLAYYRLLLLFKNRNTLNEQKTLLHQILATTRSNYSVGRTAQAEVLNLQVEEAAYLDQILTNERRIKEQLGEINHLIGRADHQHYLAIEPEESKRTVVDFARVTEETVVQKALGTSPIVRAARSSLSAAESERSYAAMNLLPDFEFKGGYTFRRPSPGDPGTDFVSGMVGISIPLWALSKQSEEKRGAEANKIKADGLLAESRNELSHNVHTIFASLEESSERLKLYEGGVLPLVRQAVMTGKAAYLTGKLEYSTLLNLLNKKVQSENSYYEAQAAYESRVADLEALVGGPLEDL